MLTSGAFDKGSTMSNKIKNVCSIIAHLAVMPGWNVIDSNDQIDGGKSWR
jgi:hypothetical protein